ncbi:hypothetical protein PENPOL_c002G09254 [Penicillium polonicum]|uniref:Reverse transcriptase Ty1/copia-type domain-containing protein n=1 Tax=Penicillium polonicum TaxID=60169 RepID=A0A1V6NX15_PENPO|nr:hypothetical protein PENPOL_c002G09254 [Penicillium polonicum]
MERQFEDLYAKGTFDIVRKPLGIKPVQSQSVYDLKATKDNEVYGFKPRRVFDAVAAYLDASRKDHETVYVIQRVGFEYHEPYVGVKGWVCQLNQALFGLRDSTALWNKELDTRLSKTDFYALDEDPCVYVKKKGNLSWFLLAHLDDFIAAAPTDGEVDQIFPEMKQQFEIKDIGEPSRFLGSAITRDYKKKTT